MSAIDLLESQHREVEELFSQIEAAKDNEKKAELFKELADKLAIHAAIEEHHFYPAVKAKRTEDILLESLEEHVTIKCTLPLPRTSQLVRRACRHLQLRPSGCTPGRPQRGHFFVAYGSVPAWNNDRPWGVRLNGSTQVSCSHASARLR